MGPNQDNYYLSAYGGDDETEEHLVRNADGDSRQHSYLHSPIVADDSVSVHSVQPRRPAHQLSVRRAAEREEQARREAIRSGLYGEPIQELEYEDYDRSSFTSLSKPYARREILGDDDDQQRIMEKLDDTHRDREYVSRPSRGPSMYQRMRMMDEGEDENDTALKRASMLLRRQLSKRRSMASDGALRRSLLDSSAADSSVPSETYGDANIPLQEISGGADRH
ncbi:hypothetical protein COEREDRAFT_79102, partial [Coemansia reversa NRRL 1564]